MGTGAQTGSMVGGAANQAVGQLQPVQPPQAATAQVNQPYQQAATGFLSPLQGGVQQAATQALGQYQAAQQNPFQPLPAPLPQIQPAPGMGAQGLFGLGQGQGNTAQLPTGFAPPQGGFFGTPQPPMQQMPPQGGFFGAYQPQMPPQMPPQGFGPPPWARGGFGGYGGGFGGYGGGFGGYGGGFGGMGGRGGFGGGYGRGFNDMAAKQAQAQAQQVLMQNFRDVPK